MVRALAEQVPVAKHLLRSGMLGCPFGNASKLRSISMPLLVVHGKQDRISPSEQGEQLLGASAAPAHRRRIMMFPDSGHNDTFLRHSREVLAATVDVLAIAVAEIRKEIRAGEQGRGLGPGGSKQEASGEVIEPCNLLRNMAMPPASEKVKAPAAAGGEGNDDEDEDEDEDSIASLPRASSTPAAKSDEMKVDYDSEFPLRGAAAALGWVPPTLAYTAAGAGAGAGTGGGGTVGARARAGAGTGGGGDGGALRGRRASRGSMSGAADFDSVAAGESNEYGVSSARLGAQASTCSSAAAGSGGVAISPGE